MPLNVISKNEGVSPVIGTILLVALTVVLVGIFGAILMGFGMAEPAPILGISIGSQGNMITVTHLNGAELPAGSYKILVDGVDKTAEFGGTVDFGPGITLSWDSGTEAVGTVSVVYTGTSGGETVLAQKTIDKAGSGGGSGGDGFEDKYTIIAGKRIEWADVRDFARFNGGAGYTFVLGNVYVDYDNEGKEEYWVSLNAQWLSTADAILYTNISEYMTHYSDYRLYLIDLSKKIYNTSDIETPGGTWKSPYPTRGSLYEYVGALYMDAIDISNPNNPSRNAGTDWVKIAYIK